VTRPLYPGKLHYKAFGEWTAMLMLFDIQHTEGVALAFYLIHLRDPAPVFYIMVSTGRCSSARVLL
jgi:hypothetical protein